MKTRGVTLLRSCLIRWMLRSKLIVLPKDRSLSVASASNSASSLFALASLLALPTMPTQCSLACLSLKCLSANLSASALSSSHMSVARVLARCSQLDSNSETHLSYCRIRRLSKRSCERLSMPWRDSPSYASTSGFEAVSMYDLSLMKQPFRPISSAIWHMASEKRDALLSCSFHGA